MLVQTNKLKISTGSPVSEDTKPANTLSLSLSLKVQVKLMFFHYLHSSTSTTQTSPFSSVASNIYEGGTRLLLSEEVNEIPLMKSCWTL